MSTIKIGLVILAAGSSSRMGSPKQLLKFGTTTLLGNAINAAVNSSCEPIIVVLGANAEQIRSHLADVETSESTVGPRLDAGNTSISQSPKRLSIITNENWPQGLASSLKAGVEKLMQLQPDTNGVIICTCDQPLLNRHVLDQLAQKLNEESCAIAASSYSNTIGTPAAFKRSLLAELLSLTGDTGAKALLKRHGSALSTVDFAGGEQDIDTLADYERLTSSCVNK